MVNFILKNEIKYKHDPPVSTRFAWTLGQK